MKIRENPESVLNGLWILFHPNTMCKYFSRSRTFRQLISIKICAWRWSWEKIFNFQLYVQTLQFFNGDSSISQARSRPFIAVWPEVAPPSKMASLTPKLSIKAYLAYIMLNHKKISCWINFPIKLTIVLKEHYISLLRQEQQSGLLFNEEQRSKRAQEKSFEIFCEQVEKLYSTWNITTIRQQQ